MSITAKDELDRIESFAETTEKRRSGLTLNELNYISDKQLHQKTSESAHKCLIFEYNFVPNKRYMYGSLIQNTVGDFDAISAAASAGTLEVYIKKDTSGVYSGADRVGSSWNLGPSGTYIEGYVTTNNNGSNVPLIASINKSDLTITLRNDAA